MIDNWKDIRRTKPVQGDGGTRKRLPDTRTALTRKVTVNGAMDVYVTVSFYPRSTVPGELFVKIGKSGSDIGGMFDALAASISIGLQYGAPWGKIVSKMKRYRFGLDPTDECPSILHAVIVAADSLVRQNSQAKEAK
jgi:hypothetical protein